MICTFPVGVEEVEWVNTSSQEPGPPSQAQSNTAVMSLVVDESEHGRVYTCRGRLEGRREQFVYKHYTIIARGKSLITICT